MCGSTIFWNHLTIRATVDITPALLVFVFVLVFAFALQLLLLLLILLLLLLSLVSLMWMVLLLPLFRAEDCDVGRRRRKKGELIVDESRAVGG